MKGRIETDKQKIKVWELFVIGITINYSFIRILKLAAPPLSPLR